MIRPPLQQLVLQGQLGETAQLVVVLLLGVAADDVVGLLLTVVDPESLKPFLPLSYALSAREGGVDAAHIGRHSRPLIPIILQGWQFEPCIISLRIAFSHGMLILLLGATLNLGEVAMERPSIVIREVIIPLLGVALVETVVEVARLAD